MYSGENVVILNYSEWIIQLGLYICYFLLLVLCTKLYIHSPSKAPNYLSYQTQKNWESKYLIDLEVKKYNEKCGDEFTQLNLGEWSGIKDYTCICYNNDNIFFTSNKKNICKYNSENNKYKDIYICKELNTINSENLNAYNDFIFCGKYSKESISTYHNNIFNLISSSNNIGSYKQSLINIEDNGAIIDIKISKNINLLNYGYESLSKENNLYIKRINKTSVNIYEFNEFITGIHYSNELICTYQEMTNIYPINNYYKNSRNIYYNNNKQCLKKENKEYINYYIDDNFVRTSIINIDINENLTQREDVYLQNSNIKNYYENIKNDYKADIMGYSNNYPILVAQKYLYGIGCQYYEKTALYYSLFRYFYHNKNISLCIIIFTLITSVTAIIFVSFNLYQNCVDYPIVYLSFCIILVTSLVTDMTLTGVYLGYSVFLRYRFGKILNICRIDFSGNSNNLKNIYFSFEHNNVNKALPIEIGLYEDLNYAMYVSLVMAVTEVIILILLILYFAFNCYRYTFISLKNESGNVVKSRKRKKRDLMELVKMI